MIRRNLRSLHHLEEAETIGDMDRTTLHIYVALEDQQVAYQEMIARLGGKIDMHSISILIDLGSTHSYTTPKVVESCHLRKKRHEKTWLVQLAIESKRKVSEVVKEFPIELNGFPIVAELNIVPLGSYDTIIEMEWLE